MPRAVKLRLVLPALLVGLLALLIVGCGCGGSTGGSTDPASVAPPKTPLFVDFTIHPEGETKANIEGLAQKVAGIDDLGSLVASKLEESAAEEGEEFDFEKEVEPWLGERAAYIYPEFEGGEFNGFALAVQVTDSGAAESFIEERTKASKEDVENGSFEGVDFRVEEDGSTIGVVDDLLVLAEQEAIFKEVVTASNGESLAESDRYSSALSGAPGDSAANVFFDIGVVIEQSGGEIDPSAKALFENAGVELDEATLAASLIPGSDNLEIDLSTNVAGGSPPAGDASELLGSLPGGSVAAFASADFGKHFNEGIDRLDEQGIPSEGIGPHELQKGLKEAGIDLEAISSSLGDAGLFLEGNSERDLGGAVVFTADNAQQAKNTVSNVGLFLRASGLPGVTTISEKVSGFSIRSQDLGRRPLIIAAKGDRVAIGYGLSSALAVLQSSGATLADSPAYKEAKSALGDTPISGFVDGPAALELASSLVPSSAKGFEVAKPYLAKIEYLALGGEASGELAVAKLIIGVK